MLMINITLQTFDFHKERASKLAPLSLRGLRSNTLSGEQAFEKVLNLEECGCYSSSDCYTIKAGIRELSVDMFNELFSALKHDPSYRLQSGDRFMMIDHNDNDKHHFCVVQGDSLAVISKNLRDLNTPLEKSGFMF